MANAKWKPSRFTPSLSGSEKFPSHGDWLLKLVDLVWKLPDGSPITLDPWQRWLIRHVLETFPKGHDRAGQLRYRRVVISMARQNGKSVLGAIFALYGLVRESGALVIGVASSSEQARIIYSRLLAVINSSASLARRFDRLTDTRGITGKDGSRYEIKAAKSAAVQGLDVSVGLADELHIMPRALWTDLINGTTARKNGVVIGITTAGDDGSELLKDIYEQIKSDNSERFGFFVWEADKAEVPEDNKTLTKYLTQANPALASGRLDLEEAIDSIRAMPEPDAVRYRLNRFVSSTNSFIALDAWAKCGGELGPRTGIIFAIDRTPDWSAATITASWRAEDGQIFTQVVASITNPTIDKLDRLCADLNSHGPIAFVADGYPLKGLLDALKRRGLPVKVASLGDITSASSMFYAKVVQRRITHASDPLLALQIPKTTRKTVGEAYRITREPGTQIDAVMATVIGTYFAETTQDVEMQIFV